MFDFSKLKDVANTLQKIGKIDEYNLILELQGQIMEMRNKILEQEDEIRSLNDKLSFKETLIPDDNVYRDPEGHAFCTRCLDKEKIGIRLTKTPATNDHQFTCPECKNRFSTKRGDAIERMEYERAIQNYTNS